MLSATHVELAHVQVPQVHAMLLGQLSLPYPTYCTAALHTNIKATTYSPDQHHEVYICLIIFNKAEAVYNN